MTAALVTTRKFIVTTQNDGTLYVLQARPPAIIALSPDGAHQTVLGNLTRTPDGIKVDAESNIVYWTNMGTGIHLIDGDPASHPVPPNDGTIECAYLDGSGHQVLVPSGQAGTPKELVLDKEGGHLYWCDREGMRVMRARIDGTEVTELVRTGEFPKDTADATRHCVGIVLDKANGHVYWTQKGPPDAGEGRIFRAGIEPPAGAQPDRRPDVECLLDNLPEPIDLDIDYDNGMLYWTDRGDDTHDGNTLNRAKITAAGLIEREVLARDLKEGIGVSLDARGRRAFVTDLGGNVRVLDIDTKDESHFTTIAHLGPLTGIDYAER
ncbi:YncE family protein [Burkholderia stagnalis]